MANLSFLHKAEAVHAATAGRKTLHLALALSAGLHLIFMITLELAPGRWSHNLFPAMALNPGEDVSPLPLVVKLTSSQSSAGASSTTELKAARGSGISSSRSSTGASLPIGERYYKSREVDLVALPLKHASLIYPEHAYLSRLGGVVKARVFISKKGRVDWVEILEVTPVKGIFEEPALQALAAVVYSPAMKAGGVVRSQQIVEVTFDPYEKAPPAASR